MVEAQLQFATGRFGDGRQAFHPVAIIDVPDAIDLTQVGAMNMAADDAIESAPTRLANDGIAESFDIALGTAALPLEKTGQ